MRFTPGCLLLLLLATSLSPAHGVFETFNTVLKCQCRRFITYRVRRGMIARVKTVAPGNGCPNLEVIVWLKNTSVLCLNPKDKWTQALLKDLQKNHPVGYTQKN